MAAIGSKRQRFVGDGNDSMRVTSLVRSLVDLPYVTGTGTSSTRIHPSPGSIVSNRLVVQSDDTARECVAFVASGGGVWRHAVPFSGGEDVAEGKEAMLKPTTVTDGVTRRCRGIRHAAEIQSLALHDKADGDEVRLASADATGKTLVTFLKRDGSDCLPVPGFDKGKRWVLQASDTSDKSSSPTPSGWTGVCFNQRNPDQVAVAKHHSKTVDVFDGETLVRRMRTPLMPRAVAYVDSNGTMGKQSETNNPLLAVAEGNALSLWDVRQSERGGCVKRVTLCNRGQPLYAVASATSQGNLGGGAVKICNKITHGDPLVITAGAERGIHVLDVARFSICKRWPSAMKFDITRLSFSRSSPDHCYVAGLDNELLCGCWSRGALAGGFAFRGDSRWLGMDSTSGGGGESSEQTVSQFSQTVSTNNSKDVVAGWCESGHLFAARVEREPSRATVTEQDRHETETKRQK